MDSLEQWVRALFAAIRNADIAEPAYSAKVFDAKRFPFLEKVVPIKAGPCTDATTSCCNAPRDLLSRVASATRASASSCRCSNTRTRDFFDCRLEQRVENLKLSTTQNYIFCLLLVLSVFPNTYY